jgi:Ca-activated chloride channel family protein
MELIGKFDYSKIQFDQTNKLHLLVSATAPSIKLATERKPITIIAAIDESGSMHGQKMDYAKKSLVKMIEHLTGKDQAGLVAFTDGARTVIPVTKVEDKAKLKNQISELRALQSTNFSAGLEMAFTAARAIDGEVRVIAFTDGQANVGIANPGLLAELVQRRPKNVSLSCFGYGEDHDSNLLTKLADIGLGNYCYVKNPDDALSAFARELGGLLTCNSQNLEFRILPKEHVKILDVMSDVDSEEMDGGAVKVKVVDLYAEETRHLVFEVEVDKVKKAFPRESTLFDLELSYDNVQTGKRETVSGSAKLQYVKASEKQDKPDQEVVDQVALCKIINAQEQATAFAASGNFAGAQAAMASATMDCFVLNSSADVQNFGGTTSSYFANNATFTSNSHNLASTKSAALRGRAAGGMSANLYASNSVSKDLVAHFEKDEDEKNSVSLPSGTSGSLPVNLGSSVTVTTGGLTGQPAVKNGTITLPSPITPNKKEEDKKKTLTRTRQSW